MAAAWWRSVPRRNGPYVRRHAVGQLLGGIKCRGDQVGSSLPEHHADQGHVATLRVPLGSEHEAAAGRPVRTRLHADESVLTEQGVGIGHFTRDRQRVATGRHHVGERLVFGHEPREKQLIEGRRDRARVKPAGIGVGRVGHAQRVRRVVHLRDEGGDAAVDLTRDEHRDVVRGRQQDRHEGIPLGELLAGLDIDDRLILTAPRLGVHDIARTDDESPAAVARVQGVVLEHEVGGHHLCEARDRDRLLVRAHRRPAAAEHVGTLSTRRPPVRRPVGGGHAGGRQRLLLRGHRLCAADDGRPGSGRRPPVRRRRGVVAELAGCRECRGGEDQSEYGPEQPAGAACSSCRSAVGHASSQCGVVLPARMGFSICRRNAPAG